MHAKNHGIFLLTYLTFVNNLEWTKFVVTLVNLLKLINLSFIPYSEEFYQDEFTNQQHIVALRANNCTKKCHISSYNMDYGLHVST